MRDSIPSDDQLDPDVFAAKLRHGPSLFVRLGWPVALLVMVGSGYVGARYFKRYDTMRVSYENARYRQADDARRVEAATQQAAAANETARQLRAQLEERERQALSCSAELGAARDGCILAARTSAVTRGEALASRLAAAVSGPAVEVRRAGERVLVTMSERALFEAGGVSVGDDGHSLIDRLGAVIGSDTSWNVAVHGHTDATPPPRASGAGSNWELSSLQAAAVTRALIDRARIDASRLTPGGFGASRPSSPPDAARDRRIELVLSYAERPNAPIATVPVATAATTPVVAPTTRARSSDSHSSGSRSAERRRTPRG